VGGFSENAGSAERDFLLKSSRTPARWVLLTSSLADLFNAYPINKFHFSS
jgi:hypothetical protein